MILDGAGYASQRDHPARAWASRMIHRAVDAAQASRRPAVAWRCMAAIVAFVSLWQGFGYAIGGDAFKRTPGWASLLTFERSLHVHGLIMLALGFLLAVKIGGDFDWVTLWTLRLLRTYSIVVTACWFGSWVHYGVAWGAPGWWMLLAALTTWLGWFADLVSVRVEHGTN